MTAFNTKLHYNLLASRRYNRPLASCTCLPQLVHQRPHVTLPARSAALATWRTTAAFSPAAALPTPARRPLRRPCPLAASRCAASACSPTHHISHPHTTRPRHCPPGDPTAPHHLQPNATIATHPAETPAHHHTAATPPGQPARHPPCQLTDSCLARAEETPPPAMPGKAFGASRAPPPVFARKPRHAPPSQARRPGDSIHSTAPEPFPTIPAASHSPSPDTRTLAAPPPTAST